MNFIKQGLIKVDKESRKMKLKDYKGCIVMYLDKNEEWIIFSKEDILEKIKEEEITFNTKIYTAKKLEVKLDNDDFIDRLEEMYDIEIDLSDEDKEDIDRLSDEIANVVNEAINYFLPDKELDISELKGVV